MVPTEALGTFSLHRGAPAAVTLQVFESDLDRALVELRRLQMRVVEVPHERQDDA